MRVITIVGAAAAALLPIASALTSSALIASAQADSTVVVRGTTFPSGRAAQLSFVGCADPYQRVAEQPQPYVGAGPGQAPAGTRSLGYDLDGGNAVGSIHYVDSVAATTVAGMSVSAVEGTSGVAYVGYQEPADSGTGRVWFGRVPLSVAAGGWHSVEVAKLPLTWTKFDMIGQRQVRGPAGGTARIPAFVKAHGGDGPGFFTIGFGCDGGAFNMDAWRFGAPGAITTYDLEGLTTVTSISGSAEEVDAGDVVSLYGSVTVGSGAPLAGARLVLEAQGPGGAWAIVDGASGAQPMIEVRPEQTTTYRWRFVDRPLAEGSVSAPFTVTVRAAGADEADEPSVEPSAKPSAKPSATKPSVKTSAKPSVKPSAKPSATPSAKPSGSGSASPSASEPAIPSLSATPTSTDTGK